MPLNRLGRVQCSQPFPENHPQRGKSPYSRVQNFRHPFLRFPLIRVEWFLREKIGYISCCAKFLWDPMQLRASGLIWFFKKAKNEKKLKTNLIFLCSRHILPIFWNWKVINHSTLPLTVFKFLCGNPHGQWMKPTRVRNFSHPLLRYPLISDSVGKSSWPVNDQSPEF